jgi:hypothetical protein
MELIGECKGNNGNGCFMDSCGHDCGCFTIQERSYSEEDMQKAFMEGHNIYGCVTDNIDEAKECFNEWFEQFKNK